MARTIRLLRAGLAAFVLGGICMTASLSSKAADQKKNTMNSLMVIFPYKHHGTWVFDDEKTGLVREPFVAGIDTMIDKMVADIPDADRGFKAVFSGAPFPGYSVKLERRRAESGGTWYFSERFGMEGWLCPALFKYFKTAPEEIYVRAEPLKR